MAAYRYIVIAHTLPFRLPSTFWARVQGSWHIEKNVYHPHFVEGRFNLMATHTSLFYKLPTIWVVSGINVPSTSDPGASVVTCWVQDEEQAARRAGSCREAV